MFTPAVPEHCVDFFFCFISASLPAIISLVGLWAVFFIFFAILYLEVFGMTRWASAETRYQNYNTLGRSIVMLIFMSTGYVMSWQYHSADKNSFIASGKTGTNICMICWWNMIRIVYLF